MVETSGIGIRFAHRRGVPHLRFLLVLAPLATPVTALAEPAVAPTEVPAAKQSSQTSTAPTAASTTPPPATLAAASTLSLAEALRTLDAESLELELAVARVEQARALTREANAGLRPSLAGTGSYVRNNDEVELRVGDLLAQLPGAPSMPNVVIQPLDAWSATATLRVPLFAPTAWHDVRAAEASEEAAKGAVEVTRMGMRSALANLAHGAAALEEVVAAAERAIELADQQVKSAERRVQAGTTAPLDVLRARAERVRRESDLARARADLERARLQLGVLLGRAEPVRITVPATPADSASPSSTESVVERRPEFRVIEARTQAGEAMRSSANSRFLPQLHANASIFASDEPYPTGDNTGWRVAVELTIPLYDGGFRYGKRDEAEAVLRLARLETAQKRLAVQQEVKDAEREIAVATERLRLAEARVGLARDAAASAQRSFVAGIATSLDVLDANDKLFQAEVALAGERARRAQAQVELARASGTL